ncbi:hypothetical protein L3X38_010659 [Prunus dulcis]|uniref:Uncharacterized protein n=1 Tax=Prunus dulcis TaxID=3755 RepID=A0AAD4WFY4_PRUDU|nr:hypothetical protein L3X38_010659 [Prunus dulcis]
MGWGGEAKTDLEVRTKLFEFGIVKLPAIVYDDGVADAEATYVWSEGQKYPWRIPKGHNDPHLELDISGKEG